MTGIDSYLGKKYSYWLELNKRISEAPNLDILEVERLLNEIIELRGKVDFYESRIKEMNRRTNDQSTTD